MQPQLAHFILCERPWKCFFANLLLHRVKIGFNIFSDARLCGFVVSCVVLSLIRVMSELPGFSCPVSVRAAFPQEMLLRVTSFVFSVPGHCWCRPLPLRLSPLRIECQTPVRQVCACLFDTSSQRTGVVNKKKRVLGNVSLSHTHSGIHSDRLASTLLLHPKSHLPWLARLVAALARTCSITQGPRHLSDRESLPHC